MFVYVYIRNGGLSACCTSSCCPEKEEKLEWIGTKFRWWLNLDKLIASFVSGEYLSWMLFCFICIICLIYLLFLKYACPFGTEKNGLMDLDEEDILMLVPSFFTLKDIPQDLVWVFLSPVHCDILMVFV